MCCVQQSFLEPSSCTSDEARLSVSFSTLFDYSREPSHLMHYVRCCILFTSVIDSMEMITVITFAMRLVTNDSPACTRLATD